MRAGPISGLIFLGWVLSRPLPAQVPYPQGTVEIPVYPVAGPVFLSGESLHYEFSWNGLRAAEGEISVCPDPQAADRFHFQGRSRTVGLAGKLWRMEDTVEAWSSSRNFKPTSYLLHLREPAIRYDREVIFDHAAGLAKSRRLGEGEVRELEFRNAFDPLSLLFVIRSLEWRAGEERRFEVIDGQERYLLVLRAVAEEEVKVPVGSFAAVKFIPALILLPRRLQGETPRFFERLRRRESQRPALVKTLEFWMAKDPPRPVLRVRSEAWIGHVNMELIGRNDQSP